MSSAVSVTMPHAMTQKNTKYLTVRVDDDLLERLAELANRNERSASSEARLAIRLHLGETTRLQPLRPVAGDGKLTA